MVSNETTGLNSLDMDPNPFPSELPQGMDNPLEAEFVRPALEQQQQEQGELDQWARTSLDSIHKEVLAIDQDSDAKSQRAKKRQIIRDLMDVKMDRRPESSFDYGVARGVFAEKYFDGSGRDDDDALFEQIRKESEVRKKSEETLTSLRDSAYLGTLGGEGFDKWAEKQGEMSAPRKNSLLASWKRHEDDVMEAFGDVAPHVKRTFRMFQQGDVETAMDYADMVITNMDDVQDEELFMAGLREVVLANPSKQVHEFLNEIGVNPLAVKGMQLVGNIDKARQTVPETMESGVVGGVDLFHKVMNADIWRYGAMGITEDDLKKKRDIYDEVRKSNDVRARIKRVFSNDFDPIKPLMPEGSSLRAIEEGVYAIPSAATTSLMAAVPYVGLAATTGTIYEFGRQNYMQELLATGMDMDRAGELAGTMAMVAAVPNVMMEKWQSFGWKGRLPGLDKIFSKVNNTVRNRAARVTMNTMIANTGEAVTELAQDAVESLVQDYGHAFSEEIPDVEWYNGQDGVFDGYFNKFLTAFTAVAPLGVSTAIGGVSADRRAEAFRALPPVVRKMYGVTQHDSDAIDNAQNPQELLEAVQRAEQNRDPNSDEAIDEVHQYAEELERKKEVMRELQRMKEMPIFRTSKESEGVVELIHPETGVVLETVQGSSAAAEAAFSYLEMQDNITQERFDELAWIIEGAILDVEEAADPKAKAELRPGQKKDVAAILSEFPEYAERAMSQSDRLDKLVAKEQLNGGTGAMSRLVWGMSEAEHEADQTSYIQRLFSGSTAFTLVHERGHVINRQALGSGVLTLQEEFDFFTKLDKGLIGKTDRNGQQLRFLPEGTEANDFRALDEAVAEFMEVMILKTQNGKKSRMRDIVGRQLSALVKANVPGATKFKAFYDAMMEFFTQALSRHFFIKKAIRDGVISESEIDAFRAKLQGTTEQEQFDADVAREAAEMAGEAPFSIGRAEITPAANTQAFPTQDGGVVGPASFSISAFHGTPHKVDRFSTEQIGTGEGAQAYGWGLYFAESRGVGESYQNIAKRLSDVIYKGKDGHYWNEYFHEQGEFGKALVWENIGYFNTRRVVSAMFDPETTEGRETLEYIDTLPDSVFSGKGNLYQVELNVEQDELLDWDKPLSEQSEQIQEVAEEMLKQTVTLKDGMELGGGWILRIEEDPDLGTRYFQELPSGAKVKLSQKDVEFNTGQTGGLGRVVYDRLAANLGGPQQASQALHAAGIKGIKYLDGDSRPSNIIDEKLLRLFERNNYDIEATLDAMMRGVYNTPKTKEKMRAAFRKDLEKGKPTYNYVIFNDADITIKTENGQEVGTTSFSISPAQNIDSLESLLRDQFPEIKKLVLLEGETAIQLHSIEIDKEERKRGIGGKVLSEIKKYANKAGKPIVISAQAEKGKKTALDRFYKSHGFTKPGRNKDFSLPRHTHIYTPPSASFSMGDAYMKDTLINNARKRMRTPQGMMQVMGDAARRVAALKREVPQVKRAFGKDYVQKEVVDPASMRDMKAQAAQLRRDEVQAAENEVYDRYGDILDNKDITRLSSQPITSRILDEGGFESLGAATSRRGDASLFGGEYEAIAGLPPIYYGGTESPDQMALILYNEGLIRENDVEVMMREVDKEITSVARHKDELAAARKIMADARKSAKRNADVWLAERVAEQKRDHNPMARAKRALQALAAIRMALPIELRGRVGDDVKLLTLNSDEKRLEYLEKTLEKVDEVVEKWQRDEFDESARKLLQRAEVKRKEPGKTDRGKFWKDYGAQLHNMFIKVDQAMKAGAAEVKGMVEGLRAELEENEQNGTLTPEKENYLESTLSLVELFGDWRNADAAEREAAVITGWRMFEEGYYNSMMAKIRDRERLDGLRAQAAQDTGKLGTAIERDDRTIRENQWQWKDLLTKQGRRDFIDKIFLGLMSFDQFLGWHFGDDSEITRKFVDWERQADYQKNDAMHAHQLALEAKFRDLAGGDPVDGLKLQNKLQTETYKTKTIPRELTLMGIIQARMMWRQEDGRRHMEGRFDDDGKLVSKWGYTQEFMDELDGLMTPEAREVEEFLSESYLSEWEGLNAVHERVWGVTMPRNGMYSPLTVSAYNVNWRDTIDPITQQSMSTMASTPTSLIRRNPKAVAEPRFDDALHVWYAHKNQIEYWKAYVEFNKEYQSVMGNRDVRDSVEAKTGKEGLASIGTWGEVLNLGGIKESSMRIGFMQAIQRGMNRTAQAALVGRLSVLAIQATQAGAASAHMPAKSYMYRLAKASMGKLNFKEAWSSDYIQRRIRQAPPAVRMAMEQMRKAEPSKANYYAYHLGKKISQTDGFFTSVTYAIIHDYQRTKLGKSNADAHKEAERLTEQVAQPLRRGTRSLFENTTINPLFKLVWAFSSEPRQKLMLSAYKTFTGRTTAEKLRAWTVTFGFGGAFASLIRAIMADIRDDDDDEIFDDKHWNVARLVAQSLTEPFSGIPVVGDGVQSIGFTAVKAAGFKPGYLPDSNLLQAPEKAAKAAVRLADDPFEDFDKTFRDVDILINGVAPFSDTAAAYTSFSHLAKDIYSIGKNALPD